MREREKEREREREKKIVYYANSTKKKATMYMKK